MCLWHEDYLQILTDIAARLGPALGWRPLTPADPAGSRTQRIDPLPFVSARVPRARDTVPFIRTTHRLPTLGP